MQRKNHPNQNLVLDGLSDHGPMMGGLTCHEADLPILGGLSVFDPAGEKLKKM